MVGAARVGVGVGVGAAIAIDGVVTASKVAAASRRAWPLKFTLILPTSLILAYRVVRLDIVPILHLVALILERELAGVAKMGLDYVVI